MYFVANEVVIELDIDAQPGKKIIGINSVNKNFQFIVTSIV